jgi:hypothetical protein
MSFEDDPGPIRPPDPAPPAGAEALVRSLVLEALSRGKAVRMKFGGGSMSPLLVPGDVIRVGPRPAVLEPGDIVLYRSSGRFVAHRVLRRIRSGGAERVLVKGDFTAGGAEALPPGSVLGVVLAREREGRPADLRTRASRALGLLAARVSPWAVRVGLLLPRPVRKALKAAVFRLAGVPRPPTGGPCPASSRSGARPTP